MAGIAVASLGQFADVFFPQILCERVIRHRLVVAYQPLFSGYLFVRTGNDLLRSRVIHTRGIRRIVMAGSTPG
jgi:Transcription termination factor nusG